MKYIIKEDRLKNLFFNYLENETDLKNLIIDKNKTFWSFTKKLEWDNRFEESPILFNYFFEPSLNDLGSFWGNKENYPILNIDPNLYDTLESLFGEEVNNLIPEYFELKYELPVKTFNYDFF